MPAINEAVRKRIQEGVAAMEEAIAAIQKAADPFLTAIQAIEGCRDKMLDDEGVEIVGHCEHCNTILFVGDKGLHCEDGPVLCEEHSPTWGDARAQWAEGGGNDDAELKADFMARYEAHIAAGGKDTDTFVHTF